MIATSSEDRTEWVNEAVRVYRRYQSEVVEACGLCPWAERARVDGKVVERVILDAEPSVDTAVAQISELMHERHVEIALLIFPRVHLRRVDFDHFVAQVRTVDARRHPLGEIPFMFAAFHPEAAPDLSTAERLIPFLRRTPDPTIQLVRASAVERVRGRVPQGTQFVDVHTFERAVIPPPSMRDRIASANFATVERMGVAELTRRLDDILRDRNETYANLANLV
jgi:hypothetical protein